jgi:hypothetical protein
MNTSEILGVLAHEVGPLLTTYYLLLTTYYLLLTTYTSPTRWGYLLLTTYYLLLTTYYLHLAHEVGHEKRGHIIQGVVISLIYSFVSLRRLQPRPTLTNLPTCRRTN